MGPESLTDNLRPGDMFAARSLIAGLSRAGPEDFSSVGLSLEVSSAGSFGADNLILE